MSPTAEFEQCSTYFAQRGIHVLEGTQRVSDSIKKNKEGLQVTSHRYNSENSKFGFNLICLLD